MFITYRRQIISVQKLRMTFTDNSYLPDILNKKKRGGEIAALLLIFMKGGGKITICRWLFLDKCSQDNKDTELFILFWLDCVKCNERVQPGDFLWGLIFMHYIYIYIFKKYISLCVCICVCVWGSTSWIYTDFSLCLGSSKVIRVVLLWVIFLPARFQSWAPIVESRLPRETSSQKLLSKLDGQTYRRKLEI